MKDVLIITSYYPPEIGAASNRIFHLADGLQKLNYKVSVITPLPNYPTGKVFNDYRGRFKQTKKENNVTIHRLWIFATVSKNKFLRLLSMLSYSFSLIWFFAFHKISKTVIIQSPPLLVAFTCMLLLRSKKRRLILNVSDLWPIAGLELGAFKKNFSYKLLEKAEQFNYKNANLVLGQSNEILTHVKLSCPTKETFLYRNYPDFEAPKYEAQTSSEKKIKIVYAGLLGVAQGIYKLCQKLEYTNVVFHVYGAGPEQQQIEKFINKNPFLSIIFHGEITRKKLHKELMVCDLAIIPLTKRIYGSVPSKIFEYAKLGLPILYFGEGEGEDIIKKYDLGWVITSGDYVGLNKKISSINKKSLNNEYRLKIKNTAMQFFDFNKQLNMLTTKI